MSRLNTVLQDELEAIDRDILALEIERNDIAGLLKKRLSSDPESCEIIETVCLSTMEPEEIFPTDPNGIKHTVEKQLATIPNDDEVVSAAEKRMGDLKNYLIEQGAKIGWIKVTLAEISKALDIVPAAASVTIDDLKSIAALRVIKILAGDRRGNNFTFNQDIPELTEPIANPGVLNSSLVRETPKNTAKVEEAKPAVKYKTPKNEPEHVQALVDVIYDYYKSKKQPAFSFQIKNLAKKVGATEGQAIASLKFIDAAEDIAISAKQASYDRSDWIFHVAEGQ